MFVVYCKCDLVNMQVFLIVVDFIFMVIVIILVRRMLIINIFQTGVMNDVVIIVLVDLKID